MWVAGTCRTAMEEAEIARWAPEARALGLRVATSAGSQLWRHGMTTASHQSWSRQVQMWEPGESDESQSHQSAGWGMSAWNQVSSWTRSGCTSSMGTWGQGWGRMVRVAQRIVPAARPQLARHRATKLATRSPCGAYTEPERLAGQGVDPKGRFLGAAEGHAADGNFHSEEVPGMPPPEGGVL